MPEFPPYTPADRLYAWYLGNPGLPQLVGTLSLVQGNRGVALQYASTWLQTGFALSEDLPLLPDLFVPRQKDTAVGAIDDARPDRWGERVIRKFERTPRLSLLEYLYFAGDDRYGALGVSSSSSTYQPWPTTPLPQLQDLQTMAEVVRQVLAGAESTLDNALSQSQHFGLRLAQAKTIVENIQAVVARWRRHFQAQGVQASDLDILQPHLERHR